jgi:predicted CXXCH cytochrome family protein
VCHAADGSPMPASETCLNCHGDLAGSSTGDKVQHQPFASGECTACHNPHASKAEHLLAGSVGETCESCHATADLYPAQALAHTPVRQGRCNDCHSGHSSNQAALLKRPEGQLCIGCHEDIRAIVEQGVAHQPVSKGKCDACHDPHGTAQNAMLKNPVPALCTNCHNPKEAALLARHGGIPMEGTDCLSCHDPHRNIKSARANGSVHAPFAGGRCGDCHKGATTALRATERTLCLECHAGLEQDLLRDKPHSALNGDKPCTSCHRPHASPVAKLLVRPNESLCASCHPGEASGIASAEYAHPSRGKGRCLVCHQPHTQPASAGSGGGATEVCSQCHDFTKHVSHPMGPETLDPRTKQPVKCVSCHAQHGSGFKYFMRDDPSGRLCVQCHTEKIRQARPLGN